VYIFLKSQGDDILKKVIVTMLLISMLTLFVGCQNSKNEVDESLKETIVVGYSENDSKEIFGDLSEEEINEITEKIADRVYEDDEYESDKKDSIIQDVFKENGIEDENKIDAAKSKITISK
jgi:uncharacterized lipoprotein NlpE involved in copper resistance